MFTIGYAGVQIQQFIDILKSNGVTHLIDVRSLPKSQYFSAFNDTNLRPSLEKHGIKYLHFKNEFGARQDNPAFYTSGVMDFEKFTKSPQFQGGVSAVGDITKNGGVVCLMCAEIDPINCHRAFCARAFQNVAHIIASRNGEVAYETQNDLENRLLEMYKTTDPKIAYQKHNQKIGFKRQGFVET